MNQEWLAQLKVGTEVAYGDNRHGKPSFEFSKVKAISSKTGTITLECETTFASNGNGRDEAFCLYLCKPEDARVRLKEYSDYMQERAIALKRKAAEKKASELISKMSVEQLDKLEALMNMYG